MRFFTPLVTLFASVAIAQSSTQSSGGATTSSTPNTPSSGQNNAVTIPNGGLVIQAGSNTIQWSNPSSGTVTIKLQVYPGVSTPQDGIVVAQNVPSSAGSATITVPADAVVPNQQYTVEIIDDTGASQPNFSTPFVVTGATGSATSSGSTTGTATMTMTVTVTTTGSSTITNTVTTSTTTRNTSTRTTTSATSTSETGAPNAGHHISGAQSGLLAFIAGVVALL